VHHNIGFYLSKLAAPVKVLLHRQIQLTTYCLPCVRPSETPFRYILTQQMAAALFAYALDDFQLSLWLLPESRSCANLLYPWVSVRPACIASE
jgi:hypothetical protein